MLRITTIFRSFFWFEWNWNRKQADDLQTDLWMIKPGVCWGFFCWFHFKKRIRSLHQISVTVWSNRHELANCLHASLLKRLTSVLLTTRPLSISADIKTTISWPRFRSGHDSWRRQLSKSSCVSVFVTRQGVDMTGLDVIQPLRDPRTTPPRLRPPAGRLQRLVVTSSGADMTGGHVAASASPFGDPWPPVGAGRASPKGGLQLSSHPSSSSRSAFMMKIGRLFLAPGHKILFVSPG